MVAWIVVAVVIVAGVAGIVGLARKWRGLAIGLGSAVVVAVAVVAAMALWPQQDHVLRVLPAQVGAVGFRYDVKLTADDFEGTQTRFDTAVERSQLYAGIARAFPATTRDGDGLTIFSDNQVYRLRPSSIDPAYPYLLTADTVSVTMSPEWTVDVVFPLPASTAGGTSVGPTFATTASAADLATYYGQFTDAKVLDGGARIHVDQNGGYTLTLKNGEVSVTADPGASPGPGQPELSGPQSAAISAYLDARRAAVLDGSVLSAVPPAPGASFDPRTHTDPVDAAIASSAEADGKPIATYRLTFALRAHDRTATGITLTADITAAWTTGNGQASSESNVSKRYALTIRRLGGTYAVVSARVLQPGEAG